MMVSCISPNGCTTSTGNEPLKEFMAGTLAGIYVIAREGVDSPWKVARKTMIGKHISSIAHEPRSGNIYVGVHGGGGLWLSEDGGYEWRQLPIKHPHVYTLAVQYRGEATVLFAGVEPASLWRSDDLGETWYNFPSLETVPEHEKWVFPPPPHISHVKNIAWHDSAPETLYVSVEQGGVFKTTDDGETWVELKDYIDEEADKFYRDIHRVLVRKSDANTVVMSTGDGFYYSSNGGTTWSQQTSRHDRVGYPDAMFLDPYDENIVDMAGSCDAPQDWKARDGNSNATVMKSTDGGISWKTINKGLPIPVVGNIEAMGMYSWDGNVAFIAGTATGEIYFSDDAGESWTVILQDLPPISKSGHYRWFLTDEERDNIEKKMYEWANIT